MAYEAWRVWMDMPILVSDPMNRTASSSWGSTPQGVSWGQSGGVATDYNVTPGWATQAQTAPAGPRFSYIETGVDVLDISAETAVDQVATGDILTTAVGMAATVAGIVDNLMMARLQMRTDATVLLEIIKRVGATQTTLASATLNLSYQAGTVFGLRLQRRTDGTVRARAWKLTSSEPQSWLAEATDTALPYLPIAFCRGAVGVGNTNVNPTIMFRKLVASTTERRVDITQYVDTVQTPMNTSTGSTAETSGETGSATITVNNARQWFTPGNPRSPFGPNITAGRRIWIEEVVGYSRFSNFSGYLEFPEIETWTQSDGASPRDQTLTLSVVDRLNRLTNGEPFTSTLAAHVMYEGVKSGALRAYYTLSENGPPFADQLGGTYLAPSLAAYGTRYLSYGQSAIAPGDDAASVGFSFATVNSQNLGGYLEGQDPIVGVPVADTDVVTLVAWCVVDDANALPAIAWLSANGIALQLDVITPNIQTYLFIDGLDTFLGGPVVSIGRPFMVAVRVRKSPPLAELWVDGVTSTGTLAGAPLGAVLQLGRVWQVGNWLAGRVGHVQVYVGPEADFNATHLAAQRAVGIHGLEGQLTGERARTLLRYAGVGEGELSRIDDGTVFMQGASLAGQTAGSALRVAEATEQGRLGVDGSGLVTFADRRRLYNI